MIWPYKVIIALTACFSTTVRANFNPCVTMNQEAKQKIEKLSDNFNLTSVELARFWDRVDKNGPIPDQSKFYYQGLGNCWTWKGYYFSNGYGAFCVKASNKKANRISFLIHHGHFPRKGMALHLCDNKSCVNPNHLIDGDGAENSSHAKKRGQIKSGSESWSTNNRSRMARGDRNGSRKFPERLKRGEDASSSVLTEEKVCAIRSEYIRGKVGVVFLSQKYGINKSTVSRIILRKTWKHI